MSDLSDYDELDLTCFLRTPTPPSQTKSNISSSSSSNANVDDDNESIDYTDSFYDDDQLVDMIQPLEKSFNNLSSLKKSLSLPSFDNSINLIKMSTLIRFESYPQLKATTNGNSRHGAGTSEISNLSSDQNLSFAHSDTNIGKSFTNCNLKKSPMVDNEYGKNDKSLLMLDDVKVINDNMLENDDLASVSSNDTVMFNSRDYLELLGEFDVDLCKNDTSNKSSMIIMHKNDEIKDKEVGPSESTILANFKDDNTQQEILFGPENFYELSSSCSLPNLPNNIAPNKNRFTKYHSFAEIVNRQITDIKLGENKENESINIDPLSKMSLENGQKNNSMPSIDELMETDENYSTNVDDNVFMPNFPSLIGNNTVGLSMFRNVLNLTENETDYNMDQNLSIRKSPVKQNTSLLDSTAIKRKQSFGESNDSTLSKKFKVTNDQPSPTILSTTNASNDSPNSSNVQRYDSLTKPNESAKIVSDFNIGEKSVESISNHLMKTPDASPNRYDDYLAHVLGSPLSKSPNYYADLDNVPENIRCYLSNVLSTQNSSSPLQSPSHIASINNSGEHELNLLLKPEFSKKESNDLLSSLPSTSVLINDSNENHNLLSTSVKSENIDLPLPSVSINNSNENNNLVSTYNTVKQENINLPSTSASIVDLTENENDFVPKYESNNIGNNYVPSATTSIIDLTSNDSVIDIKPDINSATTHIEYSQLLLEKSQIVLQLKNLQRMAQNYDSKPPIGMINHIAKLNDELARIDGLMRLKTSKIVKAEKPDVVTPKIVRNPWAQIVVDAEQVKCKGNQNEHQFNIKKQLTLTRLQDLHNSMNKCPNEEELADTPEGLRVTLLEHQRYSMTWMQWRETQKPAGGILADDMGLGKTLTMIALVLIKKQLDNVQPTSNSDDDDDDDDDYIMPSTSANASKKKLPPPLGGTLIVCPASIINQWEQEIKQRTERGLLSVYVYHGPKRENRTEQLTKYDMVITTYALVSREAAADSALFHINWQRIVLDEAHTIRNVKATLSISCSKLKGKFRWALTGTPIQNKQSDVFALLKFLKCKPFNQWDIYTLWFGNNANGASQRLHVLMKPLLLRRTKEQLKAKGVLMDLPEKSTVEIKFQLEKEEMNIYQIVMAYSRSLFNQFLIQRAERGNNDAYYRHFDSTNDNEIYDIMMNMNKIPEVKQHHILTLILRLRQICCHPALILTMLNQEGSTNNDESYSDSEPEGDDLLKKIVHAALNKFNVDSMSSPNRLQKSNPVFDSTRASSKFKAVLELLEEKIFNSDDKAIVVSQWTHVLTMFSMFLDKKNVPFCSITGAVPVKLRNEIVNDFNDKTSKTKIMLLSLTAGGVGLNLIGANHVIIMDPHWNPQLEQQAQDRIYRVGQTKNVFMYKVLCEESIEESIKELQEKKLNIANEMLTGVRSTKSTLTVADMAKLFSM